MDPLPPKLGTNPLNLDAVASTPKVCSVGRMDPLLTKLGTKRPNFNAVATNAFWPLRGKFPCHRDKEILLFRSMVGYQMLVTRTVLLSHASACTSWRRANPCILE